MRLLLSHPLAVLALSFALLSLGAWIGMLGFSRLRSRVAELREDFAVIQGATLTLLALIIGFTFSMALSRYDMRKGYEEHEANAIGTAYVRAELLPEPDASQLRALLRRYVDLRLEFYTTRDAADLASINARMAETQVATWTGVKGSALRQPSSITALVVVAVNDVIDAQGSTRSAWQNRIPTGAWVLMVTIGCFAALLIGIGQRDTKGLSGLIFILPLVISISFFLIADIDSPRSGIIRVNPDDLLALAQSLRARP